MGPWAALPLATKIGLISGGTKTLAGLGQAIFSGQKKAEKGLEKEIENIQFPSILDYYEQARQRYGVAPTQTAM